MDHFLENRGHHWEDRLKVYRFSSPSSASLVPTINWVALFLFLLVFLQILLCESTPQDFQRSSWNQLPAAPILSWSPSYQIIIKGEQIELKCSPPEGQMEDYYYFYRMNEKGEWKIYAEQDGNTLLTPSLRMSPKAAFSCFYTGRNREGIRVQSRKSNQGEFTVIEPPAAPRLFPDPPQPLYLVGEDITFWCYTPDFLLQGRRRYQFSHKRQNEDEASIKDLGWPEGNLSLVLTAPREDSGVYKCRYLEWKYERNIFSEWSFPVSIMVRDPLPPPVLKLHPPSVVMQEGKDLSILCLSSEGNNTKRFHFYQNSVELICSNEGSLKSSENFGLLTLNVHLDFPDAKDNQSLRFACRYQENISGRWVISPWSQTLNITVEPVWNQDVNLICSYARMALPLIILLVPLTFYCWKKKSKPEVSYSNTQNVFIPSPPGPTMKSHLRQEEEEEIIYYNSEF